MPAQLRRDPFARATLVRDTLAQRGRKDCKWCGKPRSKFLYGWLGDAITARYCPDGPFCSVSCWEAYHA
jgi:hypothetical protein